MYHQNIAYRSDIDGLRGFSILFVGGYHFFPQFFPGGYIGVDVFFVISGFLITSILFRELEQGVFSFRKFYIRRMRRLFPSLIFVLLACLSYGFLVLLPGEMKSLAKNTVWACTSTANFYLYKSINYFDPHITNKPLMHTWSLAIEEEFYFVFPALLWLLDKKNITKHCNHRWLCF